MRRTLVRLVPRTLRPDPVSWHLAVCADAHSIRVGPTAVVVVGFRPASTVSEGATHVWLGASEFGPSVLVPCDPAVDWVLTMA